VETYKLTLHQNAVSSMQTFLDAAQKFGYSFTADEKVRAVLINFSIDILK
jgi:hypothetical protein